MQNTVPEEIQKALDEVAHEIMQGNYKDAYKKIALKAMKKNKVKIAPLEESRDTQKSKKPRKTNSHVTRKYKTRRNNKQN